MTENAPPTSAAVHESGSPASLSPTSTRSSRPNTSMTRRGFGIDIGGSGVKGGIVDLNTGQLIGDRHKILTPHPATPDAVAAAVSNVVKHFGWTGPLGVTYPGVIINGVAHTAANVDQSWINTNAQHVISSALNNQPVAILNDADAAGLAEQHYGAGRHHHGVIVLLTFGTGIGSAVIHNGILLPNTELGHLEVGGHEAEHRAASSVKERNQWTYPRWSEEVSTVLAAIENAIWPDLFIVGGGISRAADKWVPLLTNRTPVVAAELQNTAGIVGAAMTANNYYEL